MANAQQPIIDGLNAFLAANATVSSYVSTRIYDTMAPQNPIYPFVLLTIVSDPPQHYFTGEDLKLEFQIDVFDRVEDGTKTTRVIGDVVYAALDRKNPTISGYTGVSILATDHGRIDMDLITGGRTQQDAWRYMQNYRLLATGT